jgi:hypothetical protein
MFKYSLISLLALGFTGCSYTESALAYAKEGTARVDSGYKAKADMTKYLVEYLKEANKECGTIMEIVDSKPIVKVKECVRVDDVLASVDSVEIVKPQKINDMLDSAGDFIMKSTNLVVPLGGIYYNYKTHEKSMEASIANTASNNAMQTSLYDNFTSRFDKTTTTNTTNIDTSKEVTTTSDIEKFPSVFNNDTNTTITE